MRQWKKFFAGVSLGVCTFAMAAMFSVTGADAAEVAGANLAVDYEEQQLTVKAATGDKQIYVAFPTVKNVKTKDWETNEMVVTQKVTVKTWDIYDGTATVDLSNLSPLKENYVMVKGTVSEPVMIHFTASTGGMRLTYDGANDKVTFWDKKGSEELWDRNFQYRSPYGSWKDYSSYQTKLEGHAQQGTTVYFREKPTVKSAGFGKETTTKKIDGYTTYEAGHFGGAESKVKITKRANGPKVTVDYVDCMFNIPLGTEYRFNYYQTWTPVSTYEDWKGRLTADPVDMRVNTTPNQGGIFEVRYAAVDTEKQKKAPSKYTQIAYEKMETVTLNSSNVNNTWDVIKTIVQDSQKASEMTFEYVKNAKTGLYTGLKATNVSGDKVYEIAVADNTMPGPEANLKQVATANAKNAKGVPGRATGALPKYAGKYIWVRIKADAKKKRWASDWRYIGKIITPSLMP